MTPFLQQIASLFYQQYGAEVSRLAFVFPNRRTGLFFQKYLSEEDLKEYADSMVSDVLPMICDAIRMKHKNAYSEK